VDRRTSRLIAFASLAVVGLVVGGIVAWFLGGSGDTPSATPAPGPASTSEQGKDRGGTLFVALPQDPANVNPLIAPYAMGGWISDLVNPGLVRRQVTDEGLTYEPALAESWTWSDDDLALTYTLRGDLSWEDGAPVTSDDVVFTYQLISDPKVASNWQKDAEGIDRVEAESARTVTFHFTEPRNRVLQQGQTIRGIVPRHVLGSADRGSLRSHAYGRRPTSSGPFRLTEWRSDERIVLEPNPKAPRDWRPHLDRIVLRIQPEPTTRRMAQIKGEIDLDPFVEPAQVAAYQGIDELGVVTTESASMLYIGYNQLVPTWQDERVRRALAHATDVQGLIDRIFTHDGRVVARPCVGTVGPTLGPWHASDIEPVDYDMERAKALLDEAGWIDTNNNGIRDKDGEKLRFSIMYQNGSDTTRNLLVLLKARWVELGVQVDLEPLDAGTFAARARDKRYDAMLWGFGNNPKVDPTTIWGTDGPYNWFAYSNPKVDELLATARRSTDLPTAQAAIRELQHVIYADQPVTFLVWTDDVLVRHQRFRDVQHDTFTPLRHAEQWWVPASEQIHP